MASSKGESIISDRSKRAICKEFFIFSNEETRCSLNLFCNADAFDMVWHEPGCAAEWLFTGHFIVATFAIDLLQLCWSSKPLSCILPQLINWWSLNRWHYRLSAQLLAGLFLLFLSRLERIPAWKYLLGIANRRVSLAPVVVVKA